MSGAELVPPPGSGNWHWVQTRPEIGDQIELAGWEPGSGEWIIYAEEGAWRFTAAEAHFDGWKHLAAVPTPEEIWGWKSRAADYDRALKAEADALQKLNSCGVCYTPAEVAAREAAAFKRGAEAMREACAAICDRHVERNITRASDKIAAGVGAMAMVARDSIRALPVPEDRNEQG